MWWYLLSGTDDQINKTHLVEALEDYFTKDEAKAEFLSKLDDDIAEGIISFRQGLISYADIIAEALKSSDYNEGTGFKGSGFGIVPSGEGFRLDIDFLKVRKKAEFFELVIQQLKHQGGVLIHSAASLECNKVEPVSEGYKCYFDTKDGSVPNEFIVGDLARCQRFDTLAASSKYYWRYVCEVGDDYIVLSVSDCEDGSCAPDEGDIIIQLGNRTDTSRQQAKITSVIGENSPREEYYDGINSYSLDGKLITVVGMHDPDGGTDYKMGVYTKQGRFDGQVKIGAGSSGLDSLAEWSNDELFIMADKKILREELLTIMDFKGVPSCEIHEGSFEISKNNDAWTAVAAGDTNNNASQDAYIGWMKSASITHGGMTLNVLTFKNPSSKPVDIQMEFQSDAESSYDYLMVGHLDQTSDPVYNNTSSFELSTKGKQRTVISKTYSIPPGMHTLKLMYRKDGSASTGTDSAYYRILTEVEQIFVSVDYGNVSAGSLYDALQMVDGLPYDTMGETAENLVAKAQELAELSDQTFEVWLGGSASVTAEDRTALTEAKNFYYAVEGSIINDVASMDAQSALAAAEQAKAAVDSMNDDTVFSMVEKKSIRSEWENISGIADTTHSTAGSGSYRKAADLATSAGVAYSSLTTAYNNLKTQLNTYVLYTDGDTSGFNRTTLASKFTAYYNQEIAILDAVAKADAQKKVDNVEIGGKNFYSRSTILYSLGGENTNVCTGQDSNGFQCLFDHQYGLRLRRAIMSNGWWTFSCSVQSNAPDPVQIDVDVCDTGGAEFFQIEPQQKNRIVITREITNQSNVYDFIDIVVKSLGYTLTFSDVMIEQGNKATSWSPAPEDVQSSIDNAQSAADGANDRIDKLPAGGDNLVGMSDVLAWNNLNPSYPNIVTKGNDANGEFLLVQHVSLYDATNHGLDPVFPLTYKPNTRYTIKVRWRGNTWSEGAIGLMLLDFHYTDGSYSYGVQSMPSLEVVDSYFTSDAGKTVESVRALYGYGHSTAIYDICLVEGDKVPNGYPVAAQDLKMVEKSVSDLDYLKQTFGATLDVDGATLSKLIAVKSSSNVVTAGMKGDAVAGETVDSVLGKLLLWAGSQGVTPAALAAAGTRIYENGVIETNSLKAKGDSQLGEFKVNVERCAKDELFAEYGDLDSGLFKTSIKAGGLSISYDKHGGSHRQLNLLNSVNSCYVEYDKYSFLELQSIAGDNLGHKNNIVLGLTTASGNPSIGVFDSDIAIQTDNMGIDVINRETGEVYSIYSEYGIFAGLRPIIKRITSTSYTLQSVDHTVFIEADSGTYTVNLPSYPQDGQEYVIIKQGTHTLNVRGSTTYKLHRPMMWLDTVLAIPSNTGATVTLRYSATSKKWWVSVDDMNP